jgi:hypothetical protein
VACVSPVSGNCNAQRVTAGELFRRGDCALVACDSQRTNIGGRLSDGSSCNGWRHCSRTLRRSPGCEQPSCPKHWNAADEIVQIQARQLIVHGEPETDPERERASYGHACSRNQPILYDKVADYVGSLRAAYLMTEAWLCRQGEWMLAMIYAYVQVKDPPSLAVPVAKRVSRKT